MIDGTGNRRRNSDVGIKGGRVVAVTPPHGLRTEIAKRRLDANGLVVAPGFIDSHCHSEISLIADPTATAKVHQGVTTEVLGNCGWSVAPLAGESKSRFKAYGGPIFGHEEIEWGWKDLNGYFGHLQAQGVAVNVASLVGHGALRAAVLGFEERAPTSAELGKMQKLLANSLAQGAIGMSSGLVYVPGSYAATDELVALARVVGKAGGFYATHLRDQVDHLIDSVKEALHIGRTANVPVLISHHKTGGKRNWGKVKETLALLDQAHRNGIPTSSDMYPYLSGSSTMLSLLPPWAMSGSLNDLLARLASEDIRRGIKYDFKHGLPGWENRSAAVGWGNVYVTYVGSEKNQDFVGKSIHQSATQRNVEPADLLLTLIAEERGKVGNRVINSCEEDLTQVLTHPRTMIGSDGLDVGEKPHPRLYGTFPRIFRKYVREDKLFSLEEAVYRMTGLTARNLGLEGIGQIREGYKADLTLFDSEKVRDRATYTNPRQRAEGLIHVFVGGTPVLEDGRLTGMLPGAVLRRHQKQTA